MNARFAVLTPCFLLLALGLLAGLAPAAEPPELEGVKLVEAWPDVEFNQPIRIVNAGDGSDRLYVVEKPGVIKVLPKWRGVGAVPKPEVFVDLRSICVQKAQGGVLGLAFHPKFKTNNRVFVSYLANHKDPRVPANRFKLVVGELRASGTRADAATLKTVIALPKPFPIHQGGHIAFGPDGMLYIGTGDGGSKNDKDGNAQNPLSVWGKILRIDVNRSRPGRNYEIPRDNPWPNMRTPDGKRWVVRPEIYAFGLRNPWNFSWDGSGRMWTTEPGTTGPESREWVAQIRKGGNQAWPFYEGTRSITKLPPNIAKSSLQKPTFEWVRGPGGQGTAGIGGHVYAGARIPSLRGKYIFGDYMRGTVYCIDLTGPSGSVKGTNFRKLGDVPDLSAIGTDEQGEAYFLSFEVGMIFTLAPK